MKILHTADWHLNDRLGRIDRSKELRQQVEKVATTCIDYDVDTLIVAGDLFSELARPDDLRQTILHWRTVFDQFLANGGTILAVTGNHDNENFCQTLFHAMTLASPASARPGELVAPGRFYLATSPTYLRLPDAASGGEIQFVMMPYPTAFSLNLTGRGRFGSPGERNQAMATAWGEALHGMLHQPSYRQNLPTLLVAHAHLRGSRVGKLPLFRLTEDEDVLIDGDNLLESFCYVALGHIHKPQSLGSEHIRYSGSVARMDLGEQFDEKSLCLFDVGPSGVVGEVEQVPIDCQTIREVGIRNPQLELAQLRAGQSEPCQDLVTIHLEYDAGEDNLEQLLKELDKLFPRWYARHWQDKSRLVPGGLSHEPQPDLGFEQTVCSYIENELQTHAEAERDAIMEMARKLLADDPSKPGSPVKGEA